MRKLWVCLFYALCVFTIVFSLFWMALPKLPLPLPSPGEETPIDSAVPDTAAQARPEETGLAPYYLCDEGGRVVVYRCDESGAPARKLLQTGIYVNLLPESDALRVKNGWLLQSEVELRQVLEDLGG